MNLAACPLLIGNLLVVSSVICRVTDPCSFVHEAPVAPSPRTVKRTSRRGGGGLGNLSLHLSIVIFISFILTSSSSFSFVLSVFVSFSSVPFCSYHILPYLIWTSCCAIFVFVVLPPLCLPCFSSVFEVTSPGSPLSLLLQNSVALPFPVSCRPALLPLPLLLKWPQSPPARSAAYHMFQVLLDPLCFFTLSEKVKLF